MYKRQLVEGADLGRGKEAGGLREQRAERPLAHDDEGQPYRGLGELPHALLLGQSADVEDVGRLRPLLPQASGFVPPAEIGAYYERASIVVVPSRREGYGMVAREAMAHRRPVVATGVGGLLDAVEDGVTGLLVPPRDAAALRAALERLLGDAGLRRSLGAAARERVVRTASPAKTAERLLEAYRASSVGPAAEERA